MSSINEATEKALTRLVGILEDQNVGVGVQLEAAREIIKYKVATLPFSDELKI